MTDQITRRQILKAGAALTGLGIADTLLPRTASAQEKKRALRLAHLTDIHVRVGRGAAEGMTAALRHVHALDDKPDLILQGGDFIMDALAATEAKTKEQFDLARRIMKDECTIPVRHCIGNHDIWGYNLTKSATTGNEPLWGKQWALQEMELEKPYYSFDQAGWHIIVLDTVQPRGDGGYKAITDDEQFEWLTGDLAGTPATTPVLILSHIPIVSVGAMFFTEKTEQDGQWKIISVLMMLDARRYKNLFLKHPNVKLCLAGHIHLLDRIEYNGITYITTGAISGNWWGGPFQETAEGYGLVDLYSDGTFEYQYMKTGWEAKPDPEKA